MPTFSGNFSPVLINDKVDAKIITTGMLGSVEVLVTGDFEALQDAVK